METSILTERQQEVLKAIIQEFINEATPIGSEDLVKKYDFSFSPATMRNEMVALTQKGMLQKDHVSAGRSPTPQAFRYYIKNLLDQRDIPVVNEVAMKQRLWDHRHDQSHLLREATLTLADELQNLVLVILDDGRIYSAGTAHILRHPEFYDIDLTRTVLHLIDQSDIINAILSQISDESEFGVMLGDEIGLRGFDQCGLVIGRINLPNNQTGFITTLGPYRLDYSSVIPTIKYVQSILNELMLTW